MDAARDSNYFVRGVAGAFFSSCARTSQNEPQGCRVGGAGGALSGDVNLPGWWALIVRCGKETPPMVALVHGVPVPPSSWAYLHGRPVCGLHATSFEANGTHVGKRGNCPLNSIPTCER